MKRVCLVFLAFFLVCGSPALGEKNDYDPIKAFQCFRSCLRGSQGGEGYREVCEKLCYGEQVGGGGGQDVFVAQEKPEQVQEQNPYVFEDRHFTTRLQTQNGRVRILQNFAERSRLHLGIANYRVSVLEAQPQTFILPTHWDAETIHYVAQGEGTVSVVQEDGRQSINIRQGDIYYVPAGATTYMVNTDNNRPLVIVKLIQPVAVPGYYEAFFSAGGENPQTYLNSFSDSILDSALNTKAWQRVLRQQRQGAIIKASPEQIQALSGKQQKRPFAGGLKLDSINIFEQRPKRSNQYGQLYEVDSSHFREWQKYWKNLDVSVSLVNVAQGGMIVPHYNSKATKVAFVVDGEGYFEMASPHLSSQQQGQQQQQQQSPSYQKVSSPLRRGTILVVPAGHPFTAVASNNQHLQLLCFEINSENNQRYPLAGKRNIINQLQREAKELAFGVPAREVDEAFNKQNEEFFCRGPRQQADA